MGRASRRKWEQRAVKRGALGSGRGHDGDESATLPNESAPEYLHLPRQGAFEGFGGNQQPSDALKKVYRFFNKPDEADALASGKVWLSTLERCREYEEQGRGDPEEAVHRYKSGRIVANGDNPALQLMAARSGISIDPRCGRTVFANNTYVQRLSDAFVICTTEHYSPEKLSKTFGPYCVEINDPAEFFRLVTDALVRGYPRMCPHGWGRVTYGDRSYKGLEPSPGVIGFVKPKDGYFEQQEVRFMWTAYAGGVLEPFLLPVPEVVALCTRIT